MLDPLLTVLQRLAWLIVIYTQTRKLGHAAPHAFEYNSDLFSVRRKTSTHLSYQDENFHLSTIVWGARGVAAPKGCQINSYLKVIRTEARALEHLVNAMVAATPVPYVDCDLKLSTAAEKRILAAVCMRPRKNIVVKA